MPDFSAHIFFAQLGLEVDETWYGCATFRDIYKLWDARLIVGRYTSLSSMRFGILIVILAYSLLSFSQCTEKDFIGPNQRFVYLQKLANQLSERATSEIDTLTSELELKFFCAFPDSWTDVRELVGYNKETGTQPIGSIKDLWLIWGQFIDLSSIDKRMYYEKYVNLHKGGMWTTDEFDPTFSSRLQTDSDYIFDELQKLSSTEISEVLQLMLSCSNREELESKFSILNNSLGERTSLKLQLQTERNKLLKSEPWNE